MNKLPSSALAFGLFVASAGLAHASAWDIDPSHTTAQFNVKHMMVSTVRGVFEKVSGTVTIDDKDATKSAIEVKIDPASIDTREPKRDAHLKSPDFFDVQKNPEITFKSTKVEKSGKGKFKVTGDLTMRGVTRSVTLAVEAPDKEMKSPYGQTVRGFSATGKVNRKDFGLNWNKALEAGGVLVSDEVQLQIDGELVRKDTASAEAPKAAGEPKSGKPNAEIKADQKAEAKKSK